MLAAAFLQVVAHVAVQAQLELEANHIAHELARVVVSQPGAYPVEEQVDLSVWSGVRRRASAPRDRVGHAASGLNSREGIRPSPLTQTFVASNPLLLYDLHVRRRHIEDRPNPTRQLRRVVGLRQEARVIEP